MSENDGKIHTVYMRDPLKIKSQNLPYKKTDLYGEISRGLPGPCRDLVLVANSLLDYVGENAHDLFTVRTRF